MNFIRSIKDALLASKREKQQYELALRLWSVEYKNEPFDYVYTMVQEGNVDKIGKGIFA